ncbi:MAG: hypothetical protein AAGN66_23785 [Acidobacteriota bacterium]
MSNLNVTPNAIQEAGPAKMTDLQLDCCPTCISGVDPTTLAPEYVEILKR